ncbi:hypothetical protein Y032_0421g1178 [Ancylostoma ceylanicum]|uniref:Uncharacterized protein n=1 Tax=Ancylostoma ceylanicum TaxID=53326 RepID=A0A016X168_9BILA|nr:hypothetical protein Y032_0421g1178 [Ancylostoma ceylanicum]
MCWRYCRRWSRIYTVYGKTSKSYHIWVPTINPCFKMLRSGYGPFKLVRTTRSDPIICGVGALIGVPALYFSLQFILIDMTVAWVCSFDIA